MPPARVYLFKPSSLAKGMIFANFIHLVWARESFLAILVDPSLGKGMLLAISVKEMPKFGNSCKETLIFSNFGPENAKIWQVLSRKCHS